MRFIYETIRSKKLLILTLVTLIQATPALAGATCDTNTSTNVTTCEYTAKLRDIRISEGGLMVIYPSGLSQAQGSQLGASAWWGSAFQAKQFPEVGRLMFSTALSARSMDKEVRIRMRGNQGNWPKILELNILP